MYLLMDNLKKIEVSKNLLQDMYTPPTSLSVSIYHINNCMNTCITKSEKYIPK